MNVKRFNDNVDFFIFTTNKNYANQLKSFCTTEKSKAYWENVINLLQTKHLESNFLMDEDDNNNAIDLLNNYELASDEIAYYIDSNDKIIDNFLPFDNARLNSLIKHNIAPYFAEAIGIFKVNDGIVASKPSGYILLNSLKRNFDSRLYRVGLMSDIHYEDDDVSDHGASPSSHPDSANQAIRDIEQVMTFYQNKENVNFVCCSGDVTTDSIKHLLNFKAMTIQKMPTTPFYSCFGNHDFKATSADESPITDEQYLAYENLGLNLAGKNRLQIWNSILLPQNPEFTIHYQNPSTEYGKTSYWFEVPTINGKSDIYAFLSVNYLHEGYRNTATIDYVQISSDDITIDTSKSGYNDQQRILSSTSEYNVVLKFTNISQRFKYDYHVVENYSHYVRINKCKVVDANGVDVTSQLNSSSPGIGIYGQDGKYHLTGEFEANTSNAGDRIEFPLSSSFLTNNPDITLPVTYYANVDLRTSDIDSSINDSLRSSTARLQLTEDMPYMQDILNYVGYDRLKGYDIKLYDNEALLWLKNVLETHPNKRIFIFTHQFFPQKAGGNIGSGYSYSMDNYRISETACYCLSGVQFDFLNKLNNEYPNTIWFTGHSHYDFDSQTTDRTIMICNKDYDIYKPGEIGFYQTNRYNRKNLDYYRTFDSGLSEYYKNDTTVDIDKDVLYFNIPLRNGKYNITVWANSVYTPGEFPVRPTHSILDGESFNETSVAEVYCYGYNNESPDIIQGEVQSFDLPSKKCTSLVDYDESTMLYTFTNIKGSAAHLAIKKTAEGTNWFTCGIKSIIDTTTGNDVTYLYDLYYYTAFGFLTNDGEMKRTEQVFTPSFMSALYENHTSYFTDDDIIKLVYTNKQKTSIVTNNSTGYNVHIPSTTRPLASNYGEHHTLSTAGNWSSSKRDNDSAGMIMDIYENYVDIRGVSFKLNDWYPDQYVNKYHPLGQYRIYIPSK